MYKCNYYVLNNFKQLKTSFHSYVVTLFLGFEYLVAESGATILTVDLGGLIRGNIPFLGNLSMGIKKKYLKRRTKNVLV